MTSNGLLQVIFFIVLLTCLAKLLGAYIARVFDHKYIFLDKFFKPIELFIYKCCGINPTQEMNWKSYTIAALLFNFFGLVILYFIQRWQYFLPFNPNNFGNIAPDLAFNTTASFITNTNWQAYTGESMLSYATQMFGLTVQNFVSAATGIAALFALIRGILRKETEAIGNFWSDLVRSVLYILLPLAAVLAILLISQGVIQNLSPYITADLIQPFKHAGHMITEQIIPMGPAASQIAIKQLGTNGGGFFAANSAHPFENPTPLSNLLEMLALVLIPAALCFTFGRVIKDKRQGIALYIAMSLIFIPCAFFTIHAEQQGNPRMNQQIELAHPIGGNLEGKETRFGIVNSALWTTVTTSVSNGAVNSMLDSYTPIGGMIPMWLMQLGEVVYGGVGSGLYGMLLFVILTVFVAGLMVGRTPEYLGKKIEVFDMKMACVAIIIPHLLILLCTALAVVTQAGKSSIFNPGAHGFSEILFSFTSTANNNGSAFAGLNANTGFYNLLTGFSMLCSRFWIMIPVLAIAGSMARKKIIPTTQGTMPTHTPLFIGLVVTIVLIIGALTFFPALALGPIIEHIML